MQLLQCLFLDANVIVIKSYIILTIYSSYQIVCVVFQFD